MQRFFFNLADGSYVRDEVGTELPSIRDARMEAVRFGAYVLRDRPEIVWEGHDFRVEVTDNKGLLLFTLVLFTIESPAVRTDLLMDAK